MFTSGVPLLSFAEGEKTKLPLNMQMFIVPQESSGELISAVVVTVFLNRHYKRKMVISHQTCPIDPI